MKLKSFTNKDRYGNMTSFEFYEGSDIDMGPIPPMMKDIPNHPGNPKGTDTVPAWLTPGEFVMNAEATRMFEPQIEKMNNAGRAVQAQQGGTIPEYSAHGGPVYLAEGSGNFFTDLITGLFSSGTPKSGEEALAAVNPVSKVLPNKTVPAMDAPIDPELLPAVNQQEAEPTDMTGPEALANIVERETGISQPESNQPSQTPIAGPTRPDPTVSNIMYMDFLKDKEGFREEAYLDSAGVPTIGYGFTKGVKMGDTITEEAANSRLLEEMAVTDQDYNNLVTADLNPNQQAAVKSLLYNIGGPQFEVSKARAALNAGDFETFRKEAAEFRMANGEVIPGLENRRRDELELFFKPYNSSKNNSDNKDDSDDYGNDTDMSGPEILKQIVDRETGPVDPDAPDMPVDPGLLAAVEAQKGEVPPVDAPPVGQKVGPDNRFDLNNDGILTKDEMRAASQSISEKPTTPNPAIPMPGISDNQIIPTDPNSVIARQDQILEEMIESGAKPEDIAAQVDKIAVVKNIPVRQKAFSNIIETQDNIEEVNDQVEDLDIQIKRLEAAGLYERARDLRNKRDALNNQKPILDAALTTAIKSQDELYRDAALPDGTVIPNVGNVAADVIERDGAIPPPPIDVDDADSMDGQGQVPPKPEIKTTTPEEVVENPKLPDDGSTNNQTPGGNTDEGDKPENKDLVEKGVGFFKDLFGDLYDSDELKRMAVMYAGSRVLGGSHNGSLNFVAKQYVKRVDTKISEHKKYVKELTKDGTYKPESIAKYNKTKNIADLEKKGATYAPTGGTPITKMIPQFNKDGSVKSYKKATLVPVKNSITGGTHYQSTSGAVLHPAQISSLNDYREELDDNTEAYKQRRSRILGDMKSYFEEIRDSSPDNYTEDSGKRTYRVGVGPERASLAYYDWAKRQGVDPDSTAGRKVMNQAYETMVAEAAGKDIKYTPNDFTRFLEDQQLRETTGAPELFMINQNAVLNKTATPKYVQADKMSLLYQNLDTVISQIPNQGSATATGRGDIIAIAVKKWNKLNSTEEGRALVKKYNNSAEKSAGESGFYKYMMDTAQALHSELNKPKKEPNNPKE